MSVIRIIQSHLSKDSYSKVKKVRFHFWSVSMRHKQQKNIIYCFNLTNKLCFWFNLQQLFRSQNPSLATNSGVPGQPTGQPLQQTLPLPSQPYLTQQSAAYAAAAQQAAPYVINPGQDAQYMGLIATGMAPYYGVAPWGVYPANLIPPQQGSQPRRPLTPSQQAAADNQPYQVNKSFHAYSNCKICNINININLVQLALFITIWHWQLSHIQNRFEYTYNN